MARALCPSMHMIGPWLEALRVPAVERVLIVGAGISGLTLGIALRQAGITVDILELRRDVGQQAGVGLAVQGNALAALARLGLAATCIEHGVPADYLNIRSADGALVARQPILPMGGASLPANLGISRTVLHRILLEAAAASGVVLRPGVTSECVTIDQDGVDARLTDGTVIRAGLLIGADGLYSKTRAHVYPELSPRPCGQAVWRAAVPRPQGNLTTELHFGGPLGTVGICPIAPDAAYIFVVETAPAGTHYAEADLAGVLLEKLQDYTGDMVRECIAHLAHSPAISYRPLEWLLAPAPWHRGRVVVLGDAAHANPPVLAQGAAMGIEDAVVLAELLAETVALGSQLDRFAARRHARAGLVVRNSVQLCEWEVNRQVGPREVARVMIQTQQALSLPF